MNPSYDEAEQVLKLPNPYFDRGIRRGREEKRKEFFANDTNCHQNVAGGYGASINCGKNWPEPERSGKNKTTIGAFIRWKSGCLVWMEKKLF
ncbi:hypothetical protein ABET15_06165 [Heyndrickxia faecalis]|uniref:hypothetical protein n=1 Tax=Heyndrickxia faecalis TaxID=2824910 RepID=UPI002E1BC86F|nr:hypothetical protein [Weizmannia sp. CD-2023]